MNVQLICSRRFTLLAAKPTSATASIAVADSPGWLKTTNDVAATLESVAMIIALLVGVWWVLRHGRAYSLADLTRIMSHRRGATMANEHTYQGPPDPAIAHLLAEKVQPASPPDSSEAGKQPRASATPQPQPVTSPRRPAR